MFHQNHESDLTSRSNPSEVFLGKCAQKICRKFTEEHPCQSVISIKLLCNTFLFFRTPFYRDTYGGLFPYVVSQKN